MGLNSAIYEGWVRHRRHAPVGHAFRYRMFQLYLDLAELDQVFAGRWLWSVDRPNLAQLRRRDYFGDPALPIDTAVRDHVQALRGTRPTGPIRLLTHARYFGKTMNPVSFYYCFAADGHALECVVAEITNTPWGERHAYVLPADQAVRRGRALQWDFDKAFHVSPFMAMQHRYAWRFTPPGKDLNVHMDVLDAGGSGQRAFDATLSLQRRALDGPGLARVLYRYPLMTAQVIGAIHWQALRLWLMRTPFHSHPRFNKDTP